MVFEGTHDREKVVLLSFPSDRALDDWAGSDDYRDISQHRTAGTESCVVRLRGW